MELSNNGFKQKTKVIFIMGATGSGKTRLSIDIATRFHGQIINSDKIQVYRGLDVLTNKITESECRGVRHHLLGDVHPNSDFSAHDFCRRALAAIDIISQRGSLPIIVGGSNSYIRALVEDPPDEFLFKHDCCFLCIDVAVPVLHARVIRRVDEMLQAGLLDELREIYEPPVDCTRGIWRAIGVQEMVRYMRAEAEGSKETATLLDEAVQEIKDNTCALVSRQIEKIWRLLKVHKWPIQFINATAVFKKTGEVDESMWNKVVMKPGLNIIKQFLATSP